MDLLLLIIILVASLFCFLVIGHKTGIRNGVSRSKNRLGETVPEAAGSWPLIGHLHLFAGSQTLHKLLGSMADKFGPIFTIKLGVHRVLVVSNSEMAKECLTTNDKVFASRPKSMGIELLNYNNAGFAFTPAGPYWREMRKMFVVDMVSHNRLQMVANIRVSEVKSSMIDLHTTWMRNKGSFEMVKVDMTEWFGNLILNIVTRMIFGHRFSFNEQNEDEIKRTIKRVTELLGAFVPSDAIPGLRWLDLRGYEKKMKKIGKEMDGVIDGWLQEHKKMKNSTQESKDKVLMASFLSPVDEIKEDLDGFSTDVVVKATCWVILVAGTDTTSVTLTWALALLVNNPLVLKKAHEELQMHVGKDRNVEHLDLNKLVYLQAIIKETMRLYPAAPVSLPHESTQECVVGGYTIPKGTRLLVNLWKIQHDPQIWTDPFEFQPERFLTSKKAIDVKGQYFELIPFGSGRRICPGASFALDTMQYVLANILHGFEFKNPLNEQIDMTDSHGLTYNKATPLELLVAPRLLPNCYGISA